jgi:rhamnogalacturonan endolyase
MKRTKRLISLAIAALLLIPSIPAPKLAQPVSVSANTGGEIPIVEYLNRGIVAARMSSSTTGRFVSWRALASDPVGTVYRLYRDGTRIHTTTAAGATNFRDTAGTAASRYRVDAVHNGAVFCSQDRVIRADGWLGNQGGGAYFTIPMTSPPRGQFGWHDTPNVLTDAGSLYHANDIAVGDVDGDGQYELFVKWEPNNARDAAQDGITNNVYIDCMTLEGERLWRIDLGPNIRAGAHYTQMLVADFQMNGRAQLIVKTADGTIDGRGNRIGTTQIHRNSAGRVLAGSEFLTLFCGLTGENLHTIPYVPARGNVNDWGSPRGNSNGVNRVNRFLAAVAYLDGVRPSAVPIRGYYNRMVAAAYDVVNNQLVHRWTFDTGFDGPTGSTPANDPRQAHGQGNHNVMPAAVHAGHNRQSIFLGASAIRYDGTLLWSSRRNHGDAIHVGNFIPGRARGEDIQVYSCWETSPFGVSLLHGRTGAEIFRATASSDTGRAMGGNFVESSAGSQFWGSSGVGMHNASGTRLGNAPNSNSFAIWWTGALERQLLDNTGSASAASGSWMRIERATNANGGLERVFTAHAGSINGTKANPNISADLFGDWREELIMRDGNTALVVFTTRIPTTHRITTLMHDPHYRMQVAGQNICYNQPPHTSFFLGTGSPLPPPPNVTVRGQGGGTTPTFGISLSQTTTLTFPATTVGYDEQPWTAITVTNTGNQPTGALTINTPTGFSIQGRTGLDNGIAVGATRTFEVRPSRGLAAGTHTATVTVSGGNGITSRSFNVSFTVNPAAVTAGVSAVSVGGTQTIAAADTGAARQRTVTVTGTGLTASNVQVIANTSATGTTLSNMVTVGTPTINPTGTSATVVLTFIGVAGDTTYHIRARTTSPNTTWATAPTTVTAIAPQVQNFGIMLSQAGTLTFPSAVLGYGEQEWSPITVTNIGNQPTGALEINEPTGFSIQGRTGLRNGIAVGETRTFEVRPSRGSGVGTHTATVTVSGGNGITSRSFNVSFVVTAPPCADCGNTPCNCPIFPSGRLIRDLQRLDTANIDMWSIQDNLQNGDTVYGDRTNVFTSVPNRLLGAERLRPSAQTRTLQSDTVEFIARENIFVYVGLDSRRNSADLPWLNGWQRVAETVTATDQTAPTGPGITYNLYRFPLAANQSIRLGTNGPSGSVIMYTVFFVRDVGDRSVFFNANGGTFANQNAAARTVANGGSVGILPMATASGFSREGFRFAGWFENPADENTRWRDNDTVTRSIVLHARWLPTPANFMLGNANRDASVNSADLVAIARHLAGQNVNICQLSADINGDGFVTIDDMMLLLRWLVGHNVTNLLAQ